MELIDKSALVKELREWMHKIELSVATIPLHGRQRADAAFEYVLLGVVKDFVNTFDTFKVKEVDLKKEIQSWVEDNSVNGYYREDVYETAEHFFELGLKVKKGE